MHSLHLKLMGVYNFDSKQTMNRTFTLVEELELHVRNLTSHEFFPHGLTFTMILVEGYITISTWPEKRTVQIDLFLNDSDANDVNVFSNVIDQAKSVFAASEIEVVIIDRDEMRSY